AGNEVRSPISKFLTAAELDGLRTASKAADGDLRLAVADTHHVASVSLGVLRERLGPELGLADTTKHYAMWITDFPLVERTPEGGWTFTHNPFCAPLSDKDLDLLDSEPEKALSKQYDFTVDGKEIFGGSVRIHQRAVQERVFKQMDVTTEDAAARCGALLDALD